MTELARSDRICGALILLIPLLHAGLTVMAGLGIVDTVGFEAIIKDAFVPFHLWRLSGLGNWLAQFLTIADAQRFLDMWIAFLKLLSVGIQCTLIVIGIQLWRGRLWPRRIFPILSGIVILFSLLPLVFSSIAHPDRGLGLFGYTALVLAWGIPLVLMYRGTRE